MGPSLAELLHDWHDFYVLVGTASATLVGLMFVAMSIGTSIFNEDRRAGMTAFITPTVVHFAAALFTCLLVTIPTHSWRTLGGLLAAGGLAGSIYCGRLVVQIDISGAAAHAVQRERQPHRRCGAHIASRRHAERLGHDGLDRDQDAVRWRAATLESDSIVMPVKSGVLMHWHAEVKDSDVRKTRD